MSRRRSQRMRASAPPSHVPAADPVAEPNDDGAPESRWTVTSRGSATPADVAHGGLRLAVLHHELPGGLARFSARMGFILRDALRIDGTPEAGSPAPDPLLRIARSLLEWRAEIDDADRDSFAAIALVDAEDGPACAYVGGDAPTLTCDDMPLSPLWRSMQSEGGIARACRVRIGRADHLVLAWPVETARGRVDVEAVWDRAGAHARPASERRPATPIVEQVPASTTVERPPAARVVETPREPHVEHIATPPQETRSPAAPRVESAPAARVEPAPAARVEPAPAPRVEPAPVARVESAPAPRVPAPPPRPAWPKPPGRDAKRSRDIEHRPESRAAVAPAPAATPAPQPATPPATKTPPSEAQAPNAAAGAGTPRRGRSRPPGGVAHHRPVTPASPAPPSSEDDGGLDRTRTKMGIAATVALVLLFAVGAMIGNAGNVGKPAASTLSPVQQTLAGLGLGAGRFTCSISSDPSGARVAIDGKVLDMTTPVQVELPPGAHKVTLSLPRYGGRTVDVTGRRDQHVPVEVTLWGSIQVRLPRHESAAVHVLVDGEDHGIAPIFIDHVTPGPHEVEFAASAQERWGRTFEVRIGAVTEVTAHTFDLPATGILEIDAAYEDEGGSAPVGARVWVDGRLRGRTPLKLNLARGPHSVRGEYDGEQSAVQVIDLPGGNRRFASIRFESDGDTPRLATKFAKGPTRGVMAVTATLRGVRALDLASMWLHVRFADGVWRRLPMAISTVAAGTIGITELQSSDLPRGAPVYYVSALRNTGEEYFTEIGASAPQSAPMALTP